MANFVQWTANTPAELEAAVAGYIVQGFTIANRTPTSVTVVKKKEFSIPIVVIGFVLCVVPLLIYLIYYATQQDQVFQLNLASQPQGQLSPDGHWRWDGTAWQPVAFLLPEPPADTASAATS